MLQYEIIPVTHYQQNCSLIWCDQSHEAALIDPGGEFERLMHEVNQRKLSLQKIFLTHGHLDHVGAAAEIRERLSIPIIGPQQADNFWLTHLPEQAEMFGFNPTEAFEPDQWLEDGNEVTLGKEILQVLLCPGHTPGHVVFFNAATRVVFVGDVLFRGSVGRSDFPKGNHQTLIESIKNRLIPLGEDVTFIPGHGPVSTIGHEIMHNPFLK